MKKYLFLLLTLTHFSALSQGFTKDEFLDMTLNQMKMSELFQDNISWAFFKQKMGIPTQEYNSSGMDGEFTIKHFDYSGVKFKFTDYLGPYEFYKVEITNSSYTFTYDGLQFKVGDNISTLSSKFPQAYADRKVDKMYIKHALADGIYMTLNFDPQGVITKIELTANYL